tara:strand:+ start:180 stop:437 length:258 start_codon:yes stop_codon:yes gene_type:complete
MIIEGRVQGVFFRDNTKKKANELGLKGYVKNIEDRKVEIIAEGEEDKLKELIEFCKDNPGASHVTDVKLSLEDTQKIFDRFVVEY